MRRSTCRHCRATSRRSGRATRPPERHGPIANNFPGYQTEGILNQGVRGYHYWDFLNTTRRTGSTPAATWVEPVSSATGRSSRGRPGIDSATVYTDEHGEAILQFNPDAGAALTPDSNGRCDLGEVGTGRTAGLRDDLGRGTRSVLS